MLDMDMIVAEKRKILEEIACIDSMRKGSINKQLIKTTLKNGVTKDNGPYYVLTEKDSNKKTLTESVPKEKLDFYYKEIEKYKTYVALTKRYEELSIEASRILSDGSHGDDKLKKNRTLK